MVQTATLMESGFIDSVALIYWFFERVNVPPYYFFAGLGVCGESTCFMQHASKGDLSLFSEL